MNVAQTIRALRGFPPDAILETTISMPADCRPGCNAFFSMDRKRGVLTLWAKPLGETQPIPADRIIPIRGDTL